MKFVGREDELVRFNGVLKKNGFRIISVSGPGGIGKTSLIRKVRQGLLEKNDSIIISLEGPDPTLQITSTEILVRSLPKSVLFPFEKPSKCFKKTGRISNKLWSLNNIHRRRLSRLDADPKTKELLGKFLSAGSLEIDLVTAAPKLAIDSEKLVELMAAFNGVTSEEVESL